MRVSRASRPLKNIGALELRAMKRTQQQNQKQCSPHNNGI